MAIIRQINNAVSKVLNGATSAVVSVLPEGTGGHLNSAWRLLILKNRLTSGKTPSLSNLQDIDPAEETPNTAAGKAKIEAQRAKILMPKKVTVNQPTQKEVNNQIIIVNFLARVEGSGYDSVIIQGMPSEIDINPESTWATVKSPGRNNPFYFYTGSEDTVEFEISWYSNQPDRKDVIQKCRILESWTKADGYRASPPELWISWGSSHLFRDDTFILTAAPYTLSNFQNAYRLDRNSPQVDLGLLPNAATQKLTFKRVSLDNLTTENIQTV